jgi:hypothetical protein
MKMGRALRVGAAVTLGLLAGCAGDASAPDAAPAVGAGAGDAGGQRARVQDIATAPGVGPITPAGATVLATGAGWQRMQITGTTRNLDGGTVRDADDEVVVIRGAHAIDASPLGRGARSALHADLRGSGVDGRDEDDDTIYFVHKGAADSLDAPRPAGAVSAFASCDNYDKTYAEHVAGDQTYSHHMGSQGSDFSGTADVEGNVSGNVDANVVLRVKRAQTYIFGCQTYAVAFKRLDVAGSALAHGHVKVNGTYQHAWHYQKEVVKPSLGSFNFWVGPIPVHVGFDLPVAVGFDANAKATMNADVDVTGNGTFSIQCTKDSCDGSKNVTFGFTNNTAPTASLTGKVDVTPWVSASVRGYLYTEGVAYAQVGVKPKLPTSLFFYYGNQCGDANGDGTNEWVEALTFDAGVAVDVQAKVSLLGDDKWSHDWEILSRREVGFWDLVPGGSSVLTPMLSATNQPLTGGAQPSAGLWVSRVRAGMRPCWPYADPLTYTMAWGDGAVDTITMAPGQPFVKDHDYGSHATQTATVTTVRDGAGRSINRSASMSLRPVPNVGGVVIGGGGVIGTRL